MRNMVMAAVSDMTDNGGKSGNSYQEPPILVAIALPPENTYERVIIDDEEEFVADEMTPLVLAAHEDTRDHDTIDEVEAAYNIGCRDWIFALLFYAQLIAVLYSGIVYSPKGYQHIDQFLNYTLIREQIQEQSDDMTPEQWQQVDQFVSQASEYISVYWIRIFLWNMIPSALLGYFFVHVAVLFVIPPFSRPVVQASLILTVALSMIVVVIWVAKSPSVGAFVLGGLLVGAVVYYVRLVWPMVSFAAVNLKVALIGINSNTGTHLWAFFSCKLGILWILYWIYATSGILFYLDGQCCSDNEKDSGLHSNVTQDDDNDDDCGQGKIFFLLLLSGYWTSQVIMVSHWFLDASCPCCPRCPRCPC